MNFNKILKLIITLITIEFARCENESSELRRQDLVSLIPPVTQIIHAVNDSRTIACNGTDIKWKTPQGKYVTNLSGRVHVADLSTPNDEVHMLQLFFDTIHEKDSGVWTCEGTYGKKSFELIIYKDIEFRGNITSIDATENYTVTIPCAPEGRPKPTIHWSRNGHPIPDSIHFKNIHDGLWIDRVNRSHAGLYKCKALQTTTQFVVDKDREIYLNVHYQPEILNSERMEAFNGKYVTKYGKRIKFGFINGTVDLICEATGNPMPNISWYHHGKKISHHVEQISNGSVLLTIHLHKNETYGSYKCVARNGVGQPAEYEVHIERGRRPEKPETFFLQGKGQDVFEINLGTLEEIPDDPMRITQYRIEMMIKDVYAQNGNEWINPHIWEVPVRTNRTYIVSPLQANTTYLMRVASINIAGISEWSDVKEMQTLAFEPTKSTNSNRSMMLDVPFYLLLLTMIFDVCSMQ